MSTAVSERALVSPEAVEHKNTVSGNRNYCELWRLMDDVFLRGVYERETFTSSLFEQWALPLMKLYSGTVPGDRGKSDFYYASVHAKDGRCLVYFTVVSSAKPYEKRKRRVLIEPDGSYATEIEENWCENPASHFIRSRTKYVKEAQKIMLQSSLFPKPDSRISPLGGQLLHV